jgi:hypothetical protein
MFVHRRFWFIPIFRYNRAAVEHGIRSMFLWFFRLIAR